MGNGTYDVAEEKGGIPRPARKRLGSFLTVSAIVMMTVLSDFSDFAGKTAGYFFSSRQAFGETIDDGKRSASPENEDTDQGRDIIVTEQDLQKAYKELLQEKKKEIDKTTILEADKESYYQVNLVNGGTLVATTIQLDRKTALITDPQGMTISINRQEIAGIKKIDVQANDQKRK